MVQPKEKYKLIPTKNDSRCPDYDNDCCKVEDPFDCWLGGIRINKTTGFKSLQETAKGYCPLTTNYN